MTGEVQARVDVDNDGTVQATAFKAVEPGECGDRFDRMGDGELAWQVGDEAWASDSVASTGMTPSVDHIIRTIYAQTAHRRRHNVRSRLIW